jgi:hypothetical protein
MSDTEMMPSEMMPNGGTSGNSDSRLYKFLTSSGWFIATAIFLMLVFALSIANSVFYFRIYNQSKERDEGTNINGLTVEGSYVIAIISIIVSIISFGWSLYLFYKYFNQKNAIDNWFTEKVKDVKNFRDKQIKKFKDFKNGFRFFKNKGYSDNEAANAAKTLCEQ